jgi:hypothetical protein
VPVNRLGTTERKAEERPTRAFVVSAENEHKELCVSGLAEETPKKKGETQA